MSDGDLKLRLTLQAPLAGVMYSLQEGDDCIVDQKLSDGSDLSFDLSIKTAPGPKGLRFLGPFIRREGQRRFVYFRVGALAGQSDSCWRRRGKVYLEGIKPGQVEEALATGKRLEARFAGSGKDGTPVCASIKLAGWVTL